MVCRWLLLSHDRVRSKELLLTQEFIANMLGGRRESVTKAAKRLQQAGLIRADLPVSVITFLTGALKIGIISTPDLFGSEQMPSMEQLTEAISDLIRRWLEPDLLPGDSAAGKRFVAEWLEKVKEIEEQLQ